MKKLRIEDGRLYAYISQKDVSTLKCSKNYMRPSLFQEESILKGTCDEDGYYKIENLENVHYVKGITFIPQYDYLLKFSLEELGELVKQAVGAYSQLDKLLFGVTDEERLPNEEEREILVQDGIIDKDTLAYYLSGRISADERLQVSYTLRHQSLNYLFAITSMIDSKRKEIEAQLEKEAQEKAAKKFSLKRVIRRNIQKQGK